MDEAKRIESAAGAQALAHGEAMAIHRGKLEAALPSGAQEAAVASYLEGYFRFRSSGSPRVPMREDADAKEFQEALVRAYEEGANAAHVGPALQDDGADALNGALTALEQKLDSRPADGFSVPSFTACRRAVVKAYEEGYRRGYREAKEGEDVVTPLSGRSWPPIPVK